MGLLTNRIAFELLGYLSQAGLMTRSDVKALIRAASDHASFPNPRHAPAIDFYARSMINNVPGDDEL